MHTTSNHLSTLDLPNLFSEFFQNKISKIRSDLDSQTCTSHSLSKPFSGVPLLSFMPDSEKTCPRNLEQISPQNLQSRSYSFFSSIWVSRHNSANTDCSHQQIPHLWHISSSLQSHHCKTPPEEVQPWPQWFEELSPCVQPLLCFKDHRESHPLSALQPSIHQSAIQTISICLQTWKQHWDSPVESYEWPSALSWSMRRICFYSAWSVSCLWYNRPYHSSPPSWTCLWHTWYSTPLVLFLPHK